MADPEVAFRSLATVLRAGVPLGSGALVRGLEPDARAGVERALSSGLTLGAGLAEAYELAEHERILLEASEKAGALPEVLDTLAEGRAERRRFRRRLALALAYPTLVALAAGLFLPLPLLINNGALAYVKWALPVPTLVFGAVVFFFGVLPQLPEGSTLKRLPTVVGRRLPFIGRSLVWAPVSVFAEVLGRCQKAGVPISISAPNALRATGDPAWASRADEVRRRIERGATLDESLTALPDLPAQAHQRIAIGETTGRLDDALLGIATEARERHGRTLMFMIAAITALALLTVALVAIVGIVGAAKTFYIDRFDPIMEQIDDPSR